MSNNKFIYSIFIIVTFFLFRIGVNADICSNFDLVSGSDYCVANNLSYTYINGPEWSNSSIGHVYQINSSTFSSTYSSSVGTVATEYGFCMDPGLSSPPTSASSSIKYKYFRGLNLNTKWDQDFYKTYQYYVEQVGKNGKQNKYLEAVDVAIRTFAIDDNVSLGKTYAMAKGWIADVYPYMLGNATSVTRTSKSNSGKKFYWGESSHHEYFKSFYDAIKTRENNKWWSNPLTITPTVTFDKDSETYIFNFEVKFTNATSKYFDNSDSSLINGDYNIGNGDAFFSYELKINNGTYSPSGNALDYTGGGTISKWTSNPNSTRNIYLKMSKDIYEAILEQSGEVVVNLEYSTYHAMSSDNVFLNYMNDRTSNLASTYQRMIVFSKYIEKKIINSDGSVDEKPEYNVCSQVGNKFYYGSNEVGIEEYESKCTCANINKTQLTNINIKKLVENLCPTVHKEEYTSTLGSCDTEIVDGKNSVTRYTETNINNNNKYCTVTCNEEINISNFASHFTTTAGQYFEFATYPSLIANKSCKVGVDYTDWKGDYTLLLDEQINALNKLVFDRAVRSPSTKTVSCSCGYMCVYTATKYTANFDVYYQRNNYIYPYKDSTSWGGCAGTSAPSTNSESTNLAILSEKYDNITSHFEKLKKCNKYLDTLGTVSSVDAKNFYQFTADLGFYYQQTYSSSSIGTRWNNNKANGEVDDSKFNLSNDSTTPKTQGGTYRNFINDNTGYIYISSTGAINQTYYAGIGVYNDYSITRNVGYEYRYSPSILKYVYSHTGKITSSNISNKTFDLGYVYDTDVSAVAKNDNKTEYRFSSLGDKNKIYEHYTTNLKRKCTYEITNEIINTCTGNDCSKLDIVFRIVDSNNIDPNSRLGTTEGFKNWDNIKGKTVLSTIQSDDTFNPDNLEYSFSLDSASIKKIREYNSNCDATGSCDPVKYSDTETSYSELSCNDSGNECTSKFITELAKSSGAFGKNIATNTDGRNKWKYLIYNTSTNNWSIEVKDAGDMLSSTFKSLISQYKSLGVDVTP